jgi:septum formation protein
MEEFKKFNIILASKSPRRQQLLKDLGLDFIVEVTDADETYPPGLSMEEIPVFLAELKASAFVGKLGEDDLLITADTIVWLNGEVLGKPADKTDAFNMLRKLSNNEHQVVTGVCLKSKSKQYSFYAVSNVAFKELTDDEINYYIDRYKPYDKAGAYGIQEWIGYIGITHIEGSFFNVMGLPIQKLYTELLKF